MNIANILRSIYSLILILGGILCLTMDYLQTSGKSLFFIFALFIVRGGYELNKVRKNKASDIWEEFLYIHRSKLLIFYYLFQLIFVIVGIVSININYQDQLSLTGYLIGLSFIIFGFLGLTDIYRYIKYTEKMQQQEIELKRENINNSENNKNITNNKNKDIIEIKEKYREKRRNEIKENIKNRLQITNKLKLKNRFKINNKKYLKNLQKNKLKPQSLSKIGEKEIGLNNKEINNKNSNKTDVDNLIKYDKFKTTNHNSLNVKNTEIQAASNEKIIDFSEMKKAREQGKKEQQEKGLL
ncbi:hypothetical protein SAMN00017405_1254 [Desulfonispora thiosulfatigenes DSM 11270]|uniref:Uncharacterized protein n=1 Tax=Desulfonispora thiosulfatigenes DSM 11270 TaxID=656914 RepID=A0A1W1V2G0_DESTI|nr:hypothetical protein [Desulfonispora thiosulfatigenes]SMB87211.1 hypothetical protein SAMN00017405_1254 [Desulfonispora thiosulfatigenes DSM 11270]